MRVLTDPVEIRAFRKKQVKKIARMATAQLLRGMRSGLENFSFVAACIAIMFIAFTAMFGCGALILNWYCVL